MTELREQFGNIVNWIYYEEGPDGHEVFVKKGTTYLWRISKRAAFWLRLTDVLARNLKLR